MCKSLTNYFPRDNDFLVTYFGKTQNAIAFRYEKIIRPAFSEWLMPGGFISILVRMSNYSNSNLIVW